MHRIEDGLVKRDRIREQVLTVRDTGKVNMSDVPNVERLARYYDYHDLIEYIHGDRTGYLNLIMTRKFN